ncbi:MAG TPA: AAA family ATPase [Cyclobacteriaceae bacterium]|nr:AAA family ATPase [Cyclobacteriaceae bacterium]
MNQELKAAEESAKELIDHLNSLKQEIRKVIVGQEETIDQLLVTFLAGGHALLEGVPGLAKTLMIRTLSDAIDLKIETFGNESGFLRYSIITSSAFVLSALNFEISLNHGGIPKSK